MPLLDFLKPTKSNPKPKVLMLGSGALSIGQAGEFDYSGNQAIKSFAEEGIETIVMNPNIASFQTNPSKGKKVYLYPITPFWVEKVIKKERPVGVVSSFGGQTALNCTVQLENSGVLKKYGVKVLGTPVPSLELSEDRKKFAEHMKTIGVNIPQSRAVSTVKDALEVAEEIKYPVIMRSAYALGGLGSGLANNPQELEALAHSALTTVPQVLVEKSLHGWTEMEYEVMRDSAGNSITICNMENFDPMGVHTGDSIVIAPSQTISVAENNMLKEAAQRIVHSVGVVGECNVQFALSPYSKEYFVIEINARLSRSSALASKATGYPIAAIAAKVVLGYHLLELKNPVTKTTSAFYEPSLDYVALKYPRWDLTKFTGVSQALSTQMKSTGEVMSLGRNFCESLQKAVRMVRECEDGLLSPVFANATEKELVNELTIPTPLRVYAIYESFRRGKSLEYVKNHTKIGQWFLVQMQYIADAVKDLEKTFSKTKIANPKTKDIENLFKPFSKECLAKLKSRGFSDFQLTKIALSVVSKNKYNKNQVRALSLGLRALRKKLGVVPVIKQIDTTSAEYTTNSNYLYLTYDGTHNDINIPKNKKNLITLGSGTYRIGSSCEFDWCSVMTTSYFKSDKSFDSVVINCNPETVSTDFTSSDRLYFEELSFERVLDIADAESAYGVVACMGGQNPNNLIPPLDAVGMKILGHSAKTVDMAEDRHKFAKMLDNLGIDQPRWTAATSMAEINAFIKEVGYPVLIRPSFVLSGTLMNVASDKESLDYYLGLTKDISADSPVVISEFILDAKEIECDGVAKNGEVIASFVSEHVENAGVHSGDATMVFPSQKVYTHTANVIKDMTRKIAKGLNLNGPFNIQFIAKDNDVKVIECNARASRSFPFISKVADVNLIEMACKVMDNKPVSKVVIDESEIPFVGVKASQFSYQRLDGVDPVSGVEMASTGEVGCLAENFDQAMNLAMQATQIKKPLKGVLISTGRERDKVKFMDVIENLYKLNVPVYATTGTAKYLKEKGYKVNMVNWYDKPKAVDIIKDGKVDLVINVHKTLDFSEIKYNA
ncbi:MAG: carbamoyl-phosphate synthase (glutamine-hydrolyzing) large subunit, partial [Elusimicrobia bacterium]|nr:carbamoyl-phosphate synthase (glutamine-hydrolyzing) large subunit [Elusimicrobiota bacterium]